MRSHYKILLLLGVMTLAVPRQALGATDETPADSIPAGKSLIQKVIGYFQEDSAKAVENSKKHFSFSLVGGPNYASDTKLGLGVAGMIKYRLNGCDYPLPQSYATVAANITTAGFWSLSLVGTTYLSNDRMRLNTDLWMGYSPRNYWGIGYDMNKNNANKGKLHQQEWKIKTELLFRITPSFHMGPVIEWDFHKSGNTEPVDLLDGWDHVVRNYGVGLSLQYDTRDLPTAATRGVYLYLCELMRPKFLWNDKYHFYTTDFRFCYYHKAWRDAVIAGELKAMFNFGNPSWAMMALLGNSSFMRGYYKGRYRDKHMWTSQVELRQHVWKSSGIAVWVGGGNVFHDSDSFKHFLYNFGFGYRFAFRKGSNIRLDYGFGKGQNGFMFSINEAF